MHLVKRALIIGTVVVGQMAYGQTVNHVAAPAPPPSYAVEVTPDDQTGLSDSANTIYRGSSQPQGVAVYPPAGAVSVKTEAGPAADAPAPTPDPYRNLAPDGAKGDSPKIE
jgi:hypothetical protein